MKNKKYYIRKIKKNKNITTFIYSFFVIFYLILAIYNFKRGSEWIIDNTLTIIFLTGMLYVKKKLSLNTLEYITVCIAVFFHNLGTFGFYSLKYGVVAYDNFTHLVTCGISSFLIYSVLTKKINFRKHNIMLFIIVISIVNFFGVVLEVSEYIGFMKLGVGDGLLYAGAGDSDHTPEDVKGQYIDTMEDIIVNFLGSILGSLLFLILKNSKKTENS